MSYGQRPKIGHKGAGKSVFSSSVEWLANIIAGVISFLATPWLHDHSAWWLFNYSEQNYGEGWGDPVSALWFLIIIWLIFIVLRLLISTGITIAAIRSF